MQAVKRVIYPNSATGKQVRPALATMRKQVLKGRASHRTGKNEDAQLPKLLQAFWYCIPTVEGRSQAMEDRQAELEAAIPRGFRIGHHDPLLVLQ